MQMLYNSEAFVVVQFETAASGHAVPAGADDTRADGPASPAFARRADGGAAEVEHQFGFALGGYEIVDKFARREIFIDGAVAEGFRHGVEALMKRESSADDLDEFISRYTVLAHAPLALH